MSSFPSFESEIRVHSAPTYHVFHSVPRDLAQEWFTWQGIVCPDIYLSFLEEFGTGRYFGGSLILFDIGEEHDQIGGVTSKLSSEARSIYFVIGYDGTTEGAYCLDRRGGDQSVYWHFWEGGKTVQHVGDFHTWIERSPAECFKPKVYLGHKGIRNHNAIEDVIRERAAFEVRLTSYDPTLVRPPGKERDFLPRYHRLDLLVRKLRQSKLRKLTVKVLRIGSPVGVDNVDYVTLELPDLPVGSERPIQCYSFDPFNVAFKSIRVVHTPEINLGSTMRARYTEIMEYL